MWRGWLKYCNKDTEEETMHGGSSIWGQIRIKRPWVWFPCTYCQVSSVSEQHKKHQNLKCIFINCFRCWWLLTFNISMFLYPVRSSFMNFIIYFSSLFSDAVRTGNILFSVDDRMSHVRGTVGGIIIGEEKQNTRKKPASEQILPRNFRITFPGVESYRPRLKPTT
jgi:hypothetical protein